MSQSVTSPLGIRHTISQCHTALAAAQSALPESAAQIRDAVAEARHLARAMLMSLSPAEAGEDAPA